MAKNPATVASVLTALAEHEDKTIQAAVAEHPNASEEILHQVFSTQEHILKKRKNLPASILERFFGEAPTEQPIWENNELRYLFLKQQNTPISILAELANVDLEALRADKLAKHSSPPSPEVFEKWIQDDIRFLADVAEHPQVSVNILERLAQYPNPYVQLAVAQNSKIPESLRIYLLEQLLNNSNKDICWEIARDLNTPANILEQIARELTPINQVTETLFRLIPVDSTSLLAKIRNFINNRQSFVNNRQSPEIILFWLRQDAAFHQPILEEWNQLLASLDESENQALQHLAQIAGMFAFGKQSRKDMQWLGQRLGQNPFNADGTFASNYILYGLLTWSNSAFNSDDENRSIAIALIGNSNTPLSLREQLQNQLAQPPDSTGNYKHDSDMRLAVAFNPQTPEQQRIEYLQQALSSGWSNIQETVAKNSNTPVVILEQIAQRRAGGIQDVVRNPNAPVNILRQAAQQDNSYTLRLIAENPNTPVDLLEELALNQASEVRETVLKNPSLDNLTVYAIKLKLQDREEVKQAHQIMARRPRNFISQPTTYQTSSTLRGLSRIYNPSTDDLPTVLTEYAQSENAFVRFITLLHPLTPQDILNQGAESASWLERYAVADNPATSTQIKQHLAKDANRIVRAAVTDL